MTKVRTIGLEAQSLEKKNRSGFRAAPYQIRNKDHRTSENWRRLSQRPLTTQLSVSKFLESIYYYKSTKIENCEVVEEGSLDFYRITASKVTTLLLLTS